jgi:copper chaperone CopZ
MKQVFFSLILIFISSFFFTNCSSPEEEANAVVHNKSCTIAIEGMMCEKGCKTTIQNKLQEMDGVIKAEVDFETHQAYITYDANKVSAQDFLNKINAIADGLYKSTLVEDKDIENAPVEIEGGDSNAPISVSTFSFEIPNLGMLFRDLIF